MARRRTGVPHGQTTDAMVYLAWSEPARDGKNNGTNDDNFLSHPLRVRLLKG